MGAPIAIINDTRRQIIVGTGSGVYDSQMAHLLSAIFSLLQADKWQMNDRIRIQDLSEDTEYKLTGKEYSVILRLGNDNFESRATPGSNRKELYKSYPVDCQYVLPSVAAENAESLRGDFMRFANDRRQNNTGSADPVNPSKPKQDLDELRTEYVRNLLDTTVSDF